MFGEYIQSNSGTVDTTLNDGRKIKFPVDGDTPTLSLVTMHSIVILHGVRLLPQLHNKLYNP